MPPQAMLLALLTISSSVIVTSLDDDKELELVQVLFRHGDQTPLESETYPKDPYASSTYYEPWGRGQLTEFGQFRVQRLGQILRRRYGGFLRTLSRPDDIYAYSVESDSCLASLRLIVNVLQVIKKPVAIRSLSRGIDILMNSRACPKYEAELKRIRRSPEVLQIMSKYSGLYSYITEKTDLKFDSNAKDQRLYQLYNLLEAQRSMNLSLPDWCSEGVLSLLNEIAYLHFNLESYTRELKRLNGGPLVRRFLQNMMRIRSRNNAKFYIYSGEGHNVAAFIRAIDIRFPRVPNYSSAIIVEKRRELKTTQAFAKIMIWTGVAEKLFPIRLNGCVELCPLADYARIISSSIPSNQEMQCVLNDSKEHKNAKIQ